MPGTGRRHHSNAITSVFLVADFEKRCLSDRKDREGLIAKDASYESHLPG
jgi:hypothetical protein